MFNGNSVSPELRIGTPVASVVLPSSIQTISNDPDGQSTAGVKLIDAPDALFVEPRLVEDEVHTLLSVSYTHLDVYKRQEYMMRVEAVIFAASQPVSRCAGVTFVTMLRTPLVDL